MRPAATMRRGVPLYDSCVYAGSTAGTPASR